MDKEPKIMNIRHIIGSTLKFIFENPVSYTAFEKPASYVTKAQDNFICYIEFNKNNLGSYFDEIYSREFNGQIYQVETIPINLIRKIFRRLCDYLFEIMKHNLRDEKNIIIKFVTEYHFSTTIRVQYEYEMLL